jgi:hypothetical protein
MPRRQLPLGDSRHPAAGPNIKVRRERRLTPSRGTPRRGSNSSRLYRSKVGALLRRKVSRKGASHRKVRAMGRARHRFSSDRPRA